MASATKGRFCHTRITVTASSNDAIRVWNGAATNDVTLTAGTYFVRGDDETTDTNALDLLKMLETRFDADIAAQAPWAFTLSETTHKVTVTPTAGNVAFRHTTDAANITFDLTELGFNTGGGDQSAAATQTSDYVLPSLWYPGVEGQMYDYNRRAIRTVGDSVSGVREVRRLARYGIRRVRYQLLGRDVVKQQYATAITVGTRTWYGTFEDWWLDASDGGSFVWFPDLDDLTIAFHCNIDDEAWGEELHNAAVPMEDAGGELYAAEVPMRDYVAAT